MTENTVIDFTKPSDFSSDPLTDVLRQGARDILAAAVQAEVSSFIAGHAHLLDEAGRHRLVRHGFLPEREVMPEALVLSRFCSGLFRAMFAMKEIRNGNELHRRVSS